MAGLDSDTIRLAIERRPRTRDYLIERRRIPPESVHQWRGLRFTNPALTTLDLCTDPAIGTDAIDHALRVGAVTLARLEETLRAAASRAGNLDRWRALIDSRDEPWSAAERLAHRILRASRIKGWRTNYEVVLGGRRFFIDIAFRAARLAVEIDGRQHHGSPVAFESDRLRQNALVRAGWRVLRFTWRMLTEDPEMVVAAIRAEL